MTTVDLDKDGDAHASGEGPGPALDISDHCVLQSSSSTGLSRDPKAPNCYSAWNKFYHETTTNHYKLRYNLRHFFSELLPPDISPHTHHPPPLTPISHSNPLTLLETGCGTGSTLIPLLRANPRLNAIAFDVSPVAISYLTLRQEYSNQRISAFVADLTEPGSYAKYVKESSVDYITCVFTLSAIHPRDIQKTILGLTRCLKSGGLVLMRDYARGDMREKKLKGKWGWVDGCEGLCKRGDGTLARFWEEGELKDVWEAAGGLTCLECAVMQRKIVNRRNGTTMRRKWIQGKFQKR